MKAIIAAFLALTAAPAIANCVNTIDCSSGRCVPVPKCFFGYMGNQKSAPVGRQTVNEMLQTYGPSMQPVPMCRVVNVCNAYGQCSAQAVC